VTRKDSGTVITAMTARSGEIHTSMTSTPATVISEDRILAERLLQRHRRRCRRRWFTRERTSPWGWPSKKAERDAHQLVFDVAAQPAHRALDDVIQRCSPATTGTATRRRTAP